MPKIPISEAQITALREITESYLTTTMNRERTNLLVFMVVIGKFVSIANAYINDPKGVGNRHDRAVDVTQRLQNPATGLPYYQESAASISRNNRVLKYAMKNFQSQTLSYIGSAVSYPEALQKAKEVAEKLVPFFSASVFYDPVPVVFSTIAPLATTAPEYEDEASKCAPGTVWNPLTCTCE